MIIIFIYLVYKYTYSSILAYKILYTVHCIQYNTYSTLYTIYNILVYKDTIYCIQYNTYSTLYTIHIYIHIIEERLCRMLLIRCNDWGWGDYWTKMDTLWLCSCLVVHGVTWTIISENVESVKRTSENFVNY